MKHLSISRRKTFGWVIIGFTCLLTLVAITLVLQNRAVAGIADPSEPLLQGYSDGIEGTVTSSGGFGPVVYILLQALQAVVAPIPGPVIAVIGGYLYGGLTATILSVIGSALGFFTVFLISRRLGKKILSRFIDGRRLDKYEQIISARGGIFLYVAFLIPILPDSLVGYAAGLSRLPIPKLLVIATVARAPGIAVAAFIGSSVAASNHIITIVSAALVVVSSIILFMYKERVEKWLLGDSRPASRSFDKDNPFETFEHSAFRLEGLPEYNVPEEFDAFEYFKTHGESPGDVDPEWRSTVAQNVARGATMQRLRLLSNKLTEYERFELKSYPGIAAGEEIRTALRSVHIQQFTHDFWLFDERYLYQMYYSEHGEFVSMKFKEATLEELEKCTYWTDVFYGSSTKQ